MIKMISRYKPLVLVLLIVMISACGKKGHIRDLSEYVDQLKKIKATEQPHTDMAKLPKPKVVTYSVANRRDPFQETSVSFTQKAASSPINAFPLSMLSYTGSITQDNKLWAVIMIPDGKIFQLTIGDTVGDHYGKITKIAHDHVDVTEQITDEKNRPTSQRVVSLPLKDGS